MDRSSEITKGGFLGIPAAVVLAIFSLTVQPAGIPVIILSFAFMLVTVPTGMALGAGRYDKNQTEG